MASSSHSMSAAAATVSGGDGQLAIEGMLDIRSLVQVRESLREPLSKHRSASLDLHKLAGLDTPGALFLCELRDKGVELAGVRPEHQSLLDLICGLEMKPLQKPKQPVRWRQLVAQLGKGALDMGRDTLDIVSFTGRAASATVAALLHPGRLRPASISRHIEDTGIYALPIIATLAIMISVVIGYQSIAQLRPYGGEEFTINLIAVSVLREMAALITAIMVAGRSGSAFTAEIGVMKAREEIEALQVMGIEPIQLLVVPRVIGLVIALPLLTFFADIMGLLGGAAICYSLLDVSPGQYMDRVRGAIDGYDLFVGLFKAPVFAFFIAVIGCMHGLRVRSSAESIGQETTRAVVKGIFLVIVLDALFSILFERLGV
jgi:phospholipid/cholesterol/gamma-HCH transport system permease protein